MNALQKITSQSLSQLGNFLTTENQIVPYDTRTNRERPACSGFWNNLLSKILMVKSPQPKHLWHIIIEQSDEICFALNH